MDRTILWVATLVAANVLLLGAFHARSWIPSDDGHYAHVAERLLDGQVLNRDVSEHHPGYVNFVHASALALFGRELVSLRYPLVALTLLQSLLVFALLASRGPGVALPAALAPTCLGFLQIANPAAGLYALFCCVALAACLGLLEPGRRGRVELVGLLVGLAFLFRQPTGLFAGLAATAFLLMEAPGEPGAPPRLARAVMAGLLLVLLAVLALTSDALGVALFGLWPALALGLGTRRVRAGDRRTLRIAAGLAAGAAASALPLVAYHAAHGSLAAWWSDCFVRVLAVPGLDFLDRAGFGWAVLAGLRGVLAGDGPAEILNGLYWVVLPLLSVANGLLLLRALARRQPDLRAAALPCVAVFHALVSDLNHIPFYLYLSAGLSLAALCSWSPGRGRLALAVPAGAALLGAVGVAFHAGQPHTRTLDQIWSGQRVPLVESGLARSGLRMEAGEARLYASLVEAIRRRVGPGRDVFVLPNDAAVYFLAERPNPFRLFNPTLGLHDEAEVDAFAAELLGRGPELLVHDASDPYNTALTRRLMQRLGAGYEPVEEVGRFRLYARRGAGADA